MKIATHAIASLLALGALAGCSSTDDEELRHWVADQQSQTRPKVEPILRSKQFSPQGYTQVATLDPFNQQKLTQALKRDSNQVQANAALVLPELARRKEPLESFPLDSMAMVGSLTKTGAPVGLVRVDSLLYQVRVGNYLGQNYGRVMRINESEIGLREVVQDAAGDWVERVASLTLQEKQEKTK
ncbi:MAG: pilus assembly protein PilP [Burkholderiales bacterium]